MATYIRLLKELTLLPFKAGVRCLHRHVSEAVPGHAEFCGFGKLPLAPGTPVCMPPEVAKTIQEVPWSLMESGGGTQHGDVHWRSRLTLNRTEEDAEIRCSYGPVLGPNGTPPAEGQLRRLSHPLTKDSVRLSPSLSSGDGDSHYRATGHHALHG